MKKKKDPRGRKPLPPAEKKVQMAARKSIPQEVIDKVGKENIQKAMNDAVAAIDPFNLNIGDVYENKENG